MNESLHLNLTYVWGVDIKVLKFFLHTFRMINLDEEINTKL